MTRVLLFHHAHGLTRGCLAFAEELRAAGHTVHTPDLYEGRTFAALEDGVAHAQAIGFDTVIERGRLASEQLPGDLVYAGFSLGVLPAQMLAQTRGGTKGALLFHSCVDPSEFGAWPAGLPAQVHIMEDDPWAAEGDLDAARRLAEDEPSVELFTYPGDRHLFADRGLPDYDEAAASLLTERVLEFLGRLD